MSLIGWTRCLEEDLLFGKLWSGLSNGTQTSGIWFLRRAICSDGLHESLDNDGAWLERSAYRTAWAVIAGAGCCCSHAYGSSRRVALYWRAVLVIASRYLEGSCTLSVALVCSIADSYELEPPRR